MSTNLAVIEAALKAATPGPWEASADNMVPDRAAILTAWCYEGEDAELVTDWCALADANLIANAPTWLAELVERVKVAEAATKRVRALADRLKASGFTSVYESAQELGEMVADALDGDA